MQLSGQSHVIAYNRFQISAFEQWRQQKSRAMVQATNKGVHNDPEMSATTSLNQVCVISAYQYGQRS